MYNHYSISTIIINVFNNNVSKLSAAPMQCAYRVSDVHTDYRRLPQSFHCCSLSFRTSTTPPRPTSRPPRHRTRWLFPHSPAIRPGAPDHRSVAAVSRVEWIALCGPTSSFACHVHTHTYTRARAPHTVVRENPTPAAAIVNRWKTRVGVWGFFSSLFFRCCFVKKILRSRSCVDRRPTRCRSFYRRKIFWFSNINCRALVYLPVTVISSARASVCLCANNLGRVALVVFLSTATKV